MTVPESTMREAICALGAKLAARGLRPGTSGNISARIGDGWLMTPTNSSLGELDPAQLSKLDLAGKHVGGDPPTKEALLHRSVYDVRPDDCRIVEPGSPACLEARRLGRLGTSVEWHRPRIGPRP